MNGQKKKTDESQREKKKKGRKVQSNNLTKTQEMLLVEREKEKARP
jgi:hypothetical protein